MGATLSHAIDARDHLSEWWGYGTFFVVAAAFQFILGLVLLLRPWQYDEDGKLRTNPEKFARPFYVLGLVLSSSIIILYIVSRTTGLPVAGAAREAVTPLSLLPMVVEIPLTWCLVILVHRAR